MKRYGKREILSQELLDIITTYMNDYVREELACELAPCDPETFLKEYTKYDSSFSELLKAKFSIEL